MFKLLGISLLVATTLVRADNTEFFAVDDLGTFFVRTLNLSNEEAQASAEELFEKGASIYNRVGEQKRVKLKSGEVIKYNSSENKKDSMRYLVAAGLLGHAKAAIVAMKWLNMDSFITGSREYRYTLAEVLHKKGYLYGTYILGLAYSSGNGIARDRDLALHYLGTVKDYCKSMPTEAYYSLSSDLLNETRDEILIKDGKRKCHLATSFYNSTKNTNFFTTKPLTDRVKESQEMKAKIKKAMSQQGHYNSDINKIIEEH